MTDTDPRTQVRLGCRVLAATGQSDLIWGHVSLRDLEGRGVWLKGGGLGFEEVTEDDVVLIDRAGERLEGTGRVHHEFPIHTEVLAARPDVAAVVHTHAEAAVAFGATGMDLHPIGHEGALFSPHGPARYTATSDLIRTPELGVSLAEVLGGRNAVLMVNHGLVTVGPDVETAILTAVILEKACRVQLAAAATGCTLSWTSTEEALAKKDHVYGPAQLAAAWRYLVRSLPEAGGG